MTDNSIESDEKPCPLTRGEWLCSLTAESQAKSGFKHLAVTAAMWLSMVVLVVYTVARYEAFGPIVLIIASAFCAIVVALVYYAGRTMEAFEERNKNSKIVRNILSGALTDPDEIKMRYRQTPVNANELLAECEDSFRYRYPELIFYSFTGNFKSVNRKVRFDELDCDEIKKFTLACENRRERARILMNEIGPVIGFDVVAMTVVATIVSKQCMLDGMWYDMLEKLLFVPFYGTVMVLLAISFIALFTMLAHYRIHVHAWTAFTEAAILRKSPAGGQAS